MSHRARPRPLAVALLSLAALALAACGGEEADTLSTTSSTEATTTTADGKVDDGGSDEDDVPSWERTAGPYRAQVGETVELDCDPDGEEGAVWGTNVYTDDSSVCTAAVHQGLITFDEGGAVTILIEEGQDEYIGSEANGVTTRSYPSWGGSFSFPDAEPLEVAATIDWGRNAAYYADRDATEFTVECEADGTPGSIWGTGIYTDDSSICTAAVHDGLITVEDGGEVTFRLVPGQESYAGSTANGIESSGYGSFRGSFEFVEG